MISPHPPRLRMKRRKTVSVTPAMGARTVAGAMVTAPMEREAGTTRVARALPPASTASTSAELSQNFFTALFYPRSQNEALAGARAEFLRFIRLNPWRKTLLLLRCFGLGVLAAKALHPAGGIHQLLLAGEEGVARRADFYADVALVGRAGHECVAARAMHAHFVVCGMNGCFHCCPNLD